MCNISFGFNVHLWQKAFYLQKYIVCCRLYFWLIKCSFPFSVCNFPFFFSLVELHPWLNSVHARLCIAKEMHVLVIFCGSRVNSEASASHLAESQSLVKHPHFMSVMKMIWLTCHLGVIYKMCCVVCLCCIYIFVHLSFFKNIFVLLSKDMRLSFINF